MIGSAVSDPLPLASFIFAGTRGLLDEIEVADVNQWERDFYSFLEDKRPGVLSSLTEKKELTKEIEAELTDAIREFTTSFQSRTAATAAS